MDSYSRLRFPIWVTLVFMTVMFLILVEINLPSKYSTSAKIDGFSVCEISNFRPGANPKIAVCGNLATDGVAMLGIYVYQLPEKTLVATNDAGDEFPGGFFSRILILPVDSLPGKYEVVVDFDREIIATNEFDLK